MFDFDVREWVTRFWRSLVFVVGNVELDQVKEWHEIKPKDKELKVKGRLEPVFIIPRQIRWFG